VNSPATPDGRRERPFGDYDGDGYADLFISHYVDFHLDDLPAFGSGKSCKYLGLDVQCGPRGLKGSPDSLYHNNGDGTFTDVSKKSGVDDPERRYGLTAIWSDFDNDGKLDLFVDQRRPGKLPVPRRTVREDRRCRP